MQNNDLVQECVGKNIISCKLFCQSKLKGYLCPRKITNVVFRVV